MTYNVHTIIAEMRPLVAELKIDRDFFLSGLDQFSMVVVSDDCNMTDKDEPDYGAILPESYFNKCASSPDQMLVHYLHMMGHKWCGMRWRQCPTPYETFTKTECDLIEEIYIQRMFMQLSPVLHAEFHRCTMEYEHYRPWVNSHVRSVVNTMFSLNPVVDVGDDLTHIHQLLYSSDAFDQQTFNMYIRLWERVITRGTGRKLIEQYEELGITSS